jgi:hypothetical protein
MSSPGAVISQTQNVYQYGSGSRQRFDVIERQMAWNDGDRHREGSCGFTSDQRRDEGAGTFRVGRCTKDQKANILVLVNALHDHVDLGAVFYDILGDDIFEAGLIELAPMQTEQRLSLVRLLLDVDLTHAHPVLVVLRLNDIKEHEQSTGVRGAARREIDGDVDLGRLVDNEQEFALVARFK